VHSDDSIDPLRVTFTKEWQSPTYLANKDDNGSEYICDPKEPTCKVNITVSPLLDGIVSSALSCEISADFDLVPTTDPCNPNTSIVPIGEHTLVIKILDKNKNTVLQTSTISIKNIPEDTSISPERVTYTKEWQSPTYLISKEDAAASEYVCDSEQTECKINPLFHVLLDGVESSKLTCLVIADFELISTSDPCNPKTSIVPKGEHIITIKFLDITNNAIIKTFPLTVKNIQKDDVPIDPTRVTADIVFQQPTYVASREEEGRLIYVCDKIKSECRINLLITPKLDGLSSSKLTCRVSTDFGVEIHSCNPDTLTVPP
jgi:hypothetical protein